MRKESKFYRELPEHANDYVVDLVNRLRGVNSVTGAIYVIDLCNEAADHITALLKINELVKNPKKENEEIFIKNPTVKIREMSSDNVNHPSHYADSCSIECIDAMEAMFGTDKLISFCFMNAFKYIWRFKNKNGLEDLKKARWYLGKATKVLENCKMCEELDYEFEDFAFEMRKRLEKLLKKYS